MTTETDDALAARLATAAGEVLVSLRDERAGYAPYWQVMDEGDAAAHHFLVRELAAARPDDAILSEEGLDSRARLSAERVWIIDPLDGTNEFGEPGRPDWAVHVALVRDGRPVAGAVALPAIGRTFATDPPPSPPPPLDGRRPRVVMSRNRAPHASIVVAQALGADLLRLGSAGAKTMAVVTGDADVYAHAGGMYEWDSCAPAAVAAAAGLHVSRIDGSPLQYNPPQPSAPHPLPCRPGLGTALLAALWGR